MPTLMERQLDPAAGHLLKREVEARGIKVLTGANTKEIYGNGRVEGVRLDDGTDGVSQVALRHRERKDPRVDPRQVQ